MVRVYFLYKGCLCVLFCVLFCSCIKRVAKRKFPKDFNHDIGAISAILVILLAAPTYEQSTPLSPCPNVFQYEPTGSEPGRWYGVVNLSTDSTLHSLWLNIVLDSKADILGNWVGDVTTTDNTDFKVENTKMKIHPGPAVAVRFFVQYNPLNKVPRLYAIRLNGREICNADTPQPAIDRPEETSTSRATRRPETSNNLPDSRLDVSRPVQRPLEPRPVGSRPESRPTQRPSETRLEPRPSSQHTRPVIRPEDSANTKPVYGKPAGDGPVYVPTSNPPADLTNVKPYSIGGGQEPLQSVTSRPQYQATTIPHRPARPSKNYDDFDTEGKPDPSEYFDGGQPTFILPGNTESNSFSGSNTHSRPKQEECGRVTKNKPNPLVVNGKPTLEGEWPWQIALYQTQTVDNKYICGGTLVSHQHVVTAAHCVTRKGSTRVVDKNTLTVYLGKHNLRTSVEGVQIRLVGEIIVHPEYNASSYAKDLSILKLREPVQFTDYVRPACLWPKDLNNLNTVIGKKGSVVGWGFDDTGVATEELTLVEMPVIDQETCIRSYSEFFARFTSNYTYCAGYRDGLTDTRTGTRKSTSVCNGDSGGGMVFNMDGRWYVRGLVSLSVARHNEYRCDPTHYVVFTDLAKLLPWIEDQLLY